MSDAFEIGDHVEFYWWGAWRDGSVGRRWVRAVVTGVLNPSREGRKMYGVRVQNDDDLRGGGFGSGSAGPEGYVRPIQGPVVFEEIDWGE